MPKTREIVWSVQFKRAFRKRVMGTQYEALLKERIDWLHEDPFDVRLKTHKLVGRLAGLWAFRISYDCRVVFEFLPDGKVLLIDVGTHDDVY